MAMPVQELYSRPQPMVPYRSDAPVWPRLLVFGGAAAMTVLFVREMYAVLSVARLTPIETVMLALFSVNIAWISFAFAVAVAGVLALVFCRARLDLPQRGNRLPLGRTAILIPAYNEDPARVFAAAAATAEALANAGAARAFDIFVLSDTTNPDVWIAEEAAYRALQDRGNPRARIFYRRRTRNVERKAGNVADWCRRFGAAYPYFVVLDADSLMEPDTLIRLALDIEARPGVGLIQTVPMVVNRNTLFARVQQFAGRVYGPVMSAGLAIWAGDDGNYWGHNAIIRTAAFTGAAGLPHLPGRPPFGGHVLSHDFVEAALMRRAGWSIRLVPLVGGSYEESPPSLIDLAARDRRWCQGNLQHARILPARGLAWPSRVHLLTGIMSYVASPVWLMFLLAGLLLALQARFIRPEYFTEEFQLFPTWPVIDSERAIGLFVATMAILFLPKFFGLFVALADRTVRRGIGGPLRGALSLLVESLIAALLAPVMMAIQSAAVLDILIGRDAGWNPQRRDDGSVPLVEIAKRHVNHTLFGVLLGASAWAVSPQVFAWLTPALAGLVVAVPLSAVTARADVGLALRRVGLLTIPEEFEQPEILRRAARLAGELDARLGGQVEAIARLAADPALLAFHRACLVPDPPHGRGGIDEPLVLGLARLRSASSIEQALTWLSPREKLALLADPEGLDRLVLLPHAKAAE
ncbi:membrane glycosyltransferase [Tepidamorphus gemmatus]|uniref:Glucans biosynthesis glucosyltransferase H n=2 Tax=Tepidamorphus gemmatus TaxID=747076 RepID=A0A4R3M9S8_9HYPH|nr:membrane glycosyltransferase [Tepidamorphus gemmatus]